MSNRFIVRSGTSKPTTSDLLDKEFGVDTSAEEVFLRVGSSILQIGLAVKGNTTTTNPTVNDDVDSGYVFGSHWYNSSSGKVFFCADNSDGAAVWVQLN